VERYILKERFTIKKRSTNQEIPCRIRYLDNSFLGEILNIQDLVLNGLPDGKSFKPSS
jgi:hypothetical protein